MQPFSYAPLPLLVRRGLLAGGVGWRHLFTLAERLLQAPGERVGEHLALSGELAQAAFEHNPMDPTLAALAAPVVTALEQRGIGAYPMASMMRAVAQGESAPEDAASLQALKAAGDLDGVAALLETMIRQEPARWFWRREAQMLGLYRGDLTWTRERMAGAAPPGGAWTAHRLTADLAFLAGEYDTALKAYAQCLRAGDSPLVQTRLAETLHRLGRADQAVAVWRRALAARPWQVNLLYRLRDALAGHDGAPAAPSGGLGDDAPASSVGVADVSVLFYTFNKADDLDAALSALAATETGDARHGRAGRLIRVLDNGSTDETPAVLRKWAARFGDGADFGVVRLPVNIGAPAARNWLAQLPEVQARPFVAFLDDDALVPPGWLDRLGEAVRRHPDAGVWGCKVAGAAGWGNPVVLQSVDLHLEAPPDAMEPAQPGGLQYARRFMVTSIHHQELDFGQFDYIRPCASVTGCCHLFRTTTLNESGPFDVRFNPSQYDDLEHDLRLCLQDRPPVYTGWLAVGHIKREGTARRREDQSMAGAMANLYKLQMRYTEAEFDAMRDRQAALLEEDAAAAWDVVLGR